MKLFLRVKLIADPMDLGPVSYECPTGFTSFDLDNFSDDLVVSTALKAMQQSDSIFIEIHASEGVTLGGVLKLLNAIMKYPGNVKTKLVGEHKMIERMLDRI